MFFGWVFRVYPIELLTFLTGLSTTGLAMEVYSRVKFKEKVNFIYSKMFLEVIFTLLALIIILIIQ
jgi:hypothetical protein